MVRSRRAQLAAAALLVFLALFPLIAQEKPPADAYARAHYTKHEFSIPMRDGTKLFTSVYMPKDRSTTYPIMLIRTPYSVAPYGVDQYRSTLGPSEHFMKEGFIVVYQDVRGRYMSEGEWMEVRPTTRPRKDPPTSTRAPIRGTPSIGWSRTSPTTTARSGCSASPSGVLRLRGHDRLTPGARGGLASGAGHRLLPGRRSFHNGAFLLAHNFSFYVRFLPRPGGPSRPSADRFDWGTPDGYEFYLRMGPLSNSNTKY